MLHIQEQKMFLKTEDVTKKTTYGQRGNVCEGGGRSYDSTRRRPRTVKRQVAWTHCILNI